MPKFCFLLRNITEVEGVEFSEDFGPIDLMLRDFLFVLVLWVIVILRA